MQLKILSLISVIGALGVITYVQAGPIEMVYTGDSCDCPKKLNYMVNMPEPPVINKKDIPSEYGYKLEHHPVHAKVKVTYKFDFTAEEPEKPEELPPTPEKKWQLNAKIDRMTAHKKDCINAQGVPKTCRCHQYAIADRYVLPESSAQRYRRNLKLPNSIDSMAEPMSMPRSHIMAIFFSPLKPIEVGATKSRNKRDISRILMRPRKNEKRSDRLVKQYNKRLGDIPRERTFYDNFKKLSRSRAKGNTAPTTMRPLKKLSRFFTFPRLRNKRDIKGEYDLIEKERKQKDLTLPEIVQYMPETLDPKFKKNKCPFGQSCRRTKLLKSTIKTTKTTTASTTEKSTTKATNESSDSKENAVNATDANNSHKEEEKKSLRTAQTKRNTGGVSNNGCPSVINSYNPTQKPRSFGTVINSHDIATIPQQYVGAGHNPYSSTILDNPVVGAAYAKPSVELTSNAKLDRIISDIIKKHSHFNEVSSHPGGALVDPTEQQKEEIKHFLESLMATPWSGWSGEDHQHHYHHQMQQPNAQAHSYRRPNIAPDATNFKSPLYYK